LEISPHNFFWNGLDFWDDKSFFENNFFLNFVRPLFQLLQTLKLDSFLPFLIISDTLKELHQIFVLLYFLRLIEYRGRIYTKFPVELLDTFFNLLSTVLDDDFIIFDPPKILHERLVIKHFGFINYHVVNIHVLKVRLS
jgi:hypothetical protein